LQIFLDTGTLIIALFPSSEQARPMEFYLQKVRN
jgi:hypothetical protein